MRKKKAGIAIYLCMALVALLIAPSASTAYADEVDGLGLTTNDPIFYFDQDGAPINDPYSGHVEASPDGKFIVNRSGAINGTDSLWLVDVERQQLRLLAEDPVGSFTVAIHGVFWAQRESSPDDSPSGTIRYLDFRTGARITVLTWEGGVNILGSSLSGNWIVGETQGSTCPSGGSCYFQYDRVLGQMHYLPDVTGTKSWLIFGQVTDDGRVLSIFRDSALDWKRELLSHHPQLAEWSVVSEVRVEPGSDWALSRSGAAYIREGVFEGQEGFASYILRQEENSTALDERSERVFFQPEGVRPYSDNWVHVSDDGSRMMSGTRPDAVWFGGLKDEQTWTRPLDRPGAKESQEDRYDSWIVGHSSLDPVLYADNNGTWRVGFPWGLGDQTGSTEEPLDTDGDGIPDEWERAGSHTVDGETVDLSATSVGVKDLFLYLDWEERQVIDPVTGILILTDSWAKLEASEVAKLRTMFANQGINLHVKFADRAAKDATTAAHISPCDPDEGRLQGARKLREERLNDAENKIYRYGFLALDEKPDGCEGAQRAVGETYGLVFFVARNAYGSSEAYLRTIAHEFGHTLGLGHGGPLYRDGKKGDDLPYAPRLPSTENNADSADLNCKRMYRSIMNYSYQIRSDLHEMNLSTSSGFSPLNSIPGNGAPEECREPDPKLVADGDYRYYADWPHLAFAVDGIGTLANSVEAPTGVVDEVVPTPDMYPDGAAAVKFASPHVLAADTANVVTLSVKNVSATTARYLLELDTGEGVTTEAVTVPATSTRWVDLPVTIPPADQTVELTARLKFADTGAEIDQRKATFTVVPHQVAINVLDAIKADPELADVFPVESLAGVTEAWQEDSDPSAPDVTVIDIPSRPGVDDPAGPDNARWIVPEDTDTLMWLVTDEGHLVASIVAKDTTFPDGRTAHDFGSAPDSHQPTEPVTVTPETPVRKGNIVRIPSHEGIRYQGTNGEELAGTVSIPRSGLTITATAKDGYVLDENATTEWQFGYESKTGKPWWANRWKQWTPSSEPHKPLAFIGRLLERLFR